MQNKSKVVFKGKTQEKYEFEIFPLNTVFEEGDEAIFFVTKWKEKNDKHTKVFLGETDDLGRYFNPLCKFTFSEHYGANCICCHREQDSEIRSKKLRDLRAFNATLYKGYPREHMGIITKLLKETDIIWEVSDTPVAA